MQLVQPTVLVHDDVTAAGVAAADEAAATLQAAIASRGSARALFASAPSQLAMLTSLRGHDIDWSAVEVFHIDEYVGLAAADPRGFGQWLCDHLFDQVRPFTVNLLDSSATTPETEATRYAGLLGDGEIDLACIGIGINGHIAFNEPYQWEIEDERLVAPVKLQEASRQQQVDDQCFATIEEVPTHAISITVPGLLRARHLTVTVTGGHKQAAVAAALMPGLNPACPASALQAHPSVVLHLDPTADPAAISMGAI